jgi:hypothetical protein
MIHYTPEGHHKKLGLNLFRAPGGFVAVWAWYDFATHEASSYRLRLRLHIKPRIVWTVERYNVITSHLWDIDCELVQREVLADLKAVEGDVKRINEPLAYIKPQ